MQILATINSVLFFFVMYVYHNTESNLSILIIIEIACNGKLTELYQRVEFICWSALFFASVDTAW